MRFHLIHDGQGRAATLGVLVFLVLLVAAVGTAQASSASGGRNPGFQLSREPVMDPVPDTYAFWARDVSDADVYRIQGTWYAYHGGSWYAAENWQGPWGALPASSLPYTIAHMQSGCEHFEHATGMPMTGSEMNGGQMLMYGGIAHHMRSDMRRHGTPMHHPHHRHPRRHVSLGSL